MKIVVLAGGYSPERDVSLCSGSLIANALIENGHQVLLADLYLGIPEEDYEDLYFTKASGKRYHYEIPETEPDLKKLKEESGNGAALIGPRIIEACQKADLAFLALHGAIGENGMLQAVFDTHGIHYTGTGYEGCLLAMNKDISKKLMVAANINTAPWKTYSLQTLDLSQFADVSYPCVVKPLSCGSSVGVSLLDNEQELLEALKSAMVYETNVLIEKKITGREFSVGILNDTALPSIEIIPKKGFYDYKNKYQSGYTTEICPAQISETLELRLREAALNVHHALHLGFYSRVDFLVDEDNTLWCLEANTLPGMTPISLLPQEAKAAGISYNELCERIARAAV